MFPRLNDFLFEILHFNVNKEVEMENLKRETIVTNRSQGKYIFEEVEMRNSNKNHFDSTEIIQCLS